MGCSTPEGVIVGFTPTPGPATACATRLLNARGRHRRVHAWVVTCANPWSSCSTPEGVIVGFTRLIGEYDGIPVYCSTPEGVIVGFTG